MTIIDPLADFPGYAFKRASNNMMSILAKQLSPIGVGATDATILILIDANMGLTQTDLCKALDINKANMTPRITKLVAAGLITRKRLDGRSHTLALTDCGTAKRDEAYTIMRNHEAQLACRIAPEHFDHFVMALRGLWENPDLDG